MGQIYQRGYQLWEHGAADQEGAPGSQNVIDEFFVALVDPGKTSF
jgi:hypothetical protein